MATSDAGELGISDATTTSQERAVGITVFVSPNVPGFNCTIKRRYTDFLVNEILPNGQVLHLTNVGPELEVGRKNNGSSNSAEMPNGDIRESHAPSEHNANSSLKRQGREEDDLIIDGDGTSAKKPRLEETGAQNALVDASEVAIDASSLSNKDRIRETISKVRETDQSSLQNIFGEHVTHRILDLYANVMLHPDRKPRELPFIKSDVISEKAKRTEAHVAIRRIFSSKLETATLQDLPGVISIKAASTKGPSGARGQPNVDAGSGAYQKGKLGWSDLGGEYLHFTLYKENKDTMEVLYYIASRLKVPVKNFQFAGTKDRRAVTVQRVAIFRVHADRIAELNKSAKGWRAGNFEYKKHGLELGELGGNEFLLTLRDCYFKGEESLLHEQRVILARRMLEKATESFAEHGYLNYYGLQRFGSFSTGTHITGQKMLSGDLEGAVNSILAYSEDLLSENLKGQETNKVPQDDIDRAEAIRLSRAGETNDAVKKMPKRFQAEAAIIQYLGKKDRKSGMLVQDRDWQGALAQIPRNLRMMYVHAYQSFIWNTVAGKRWELYDNKVVEGDLVIIGEKDGDTGPARDEVDEDGELIFHPAADDSAPSTEDAYTRGRHLSKEEAESGKYDIFDVILPLPGYDVLYPANTIGKFYEEFMSSEAGGGIDPHSMRRSWKDISLSGAYRKLMARPGGIEFEIKSYAANEEQMVETDLERVQRQVSAQGNGERQLKDEKSRQLDVSLAKKIAVVLKFQLGSSQYATIAMRELTKGGAVHFKPDYAAR